MNHVGITIGVPGFFALDTSVSTFYVLSGFFFDNSINCSGDHKSFILKKVKSLLTPFLLYYLLSYAVFYFLHFFMPDFSLGSVEYHGVEDLFLQRNLFNGPIWFILSLFYVELLALAVHTINDHRIEALVVVLLSMCGYLLHKYGIDILACLDMTFMALFFFYFGRLLKVFYNKWIAVKSGSWITIIILSIVLYVVFVLQRPTIIWRDNAFTPNYFAVTTGGLAIVLSLSFLIIIIGALMPLKPLAWLGRNSLIVLGTHHLVYRFVQFCLENIVHVYSTFVVFIITMSFVSIMVILINKYIPVLAGNKMSK